jgi:hypothetical protein
MNSRKTGEFLQFRQITVVLSSMNLTRGFSCFDAVALIPRVQFEKSSCRVLFHKNTDTSFVTTGLKKLDDAPRHSPP